MLRAACLIVVSTLLIPGPAWAADGPKAHRHDQDDWKDAWRDAQRDYKDWLEELQERQEKAQKDAQKDAQKRHKETVRELQKWQRRYGRYGFVPPPDLYQSLPPALLPPAPAPAPQPEMLPTPEGLRLPPSGPTPF